MNVESIIAEKGRHVVTVGPGSLLGDIVSLLSEKRIGAVVVTEGEAIRGIISERDIVRMLARDGAQALARKASEAMTARVITCSPADTIHQVMQQMTSGRFRHVPVLHDGRLAGIISIGDVVKRRIEEVEREAEQIREYIATA
jgi:CBS domain-containing protein